MTRSLLLFLALAAAGSILFSTGWRAPFVLDDVNKIVNNPDLHTKEFRLNDFFYRYTPGRPANRNDPSRPLPYMLYWACWQIGGGSPTPFYLLNLLLHISSALLVGLLAHRFSPQSRFLLAACSFWFLSLPLNAGAVSYAYALNDLLSTFFALWILYLSLHLNRWHQYVLVALLYVLALATKQSMVVIPCLIVTIDIFTSNFRKSRILLYGMFAALSVAYIFLRHYHLGGIGDLEAQLAIPQKLYLIAEGAVLWLYYYKFLIPINLSIQHSVQPLPLALAYGGWLMLALVTIVCFVSPVRNHPQRKWFALAFLTFLGVLLPVSSLFPTADLFVERRAYLASAVAIVFLGVGLAGLNMNRKIAAAVISVVFLAHSIVTVRQVAIKSTEVGLWQHVLKLYPRDTRAYLGLSYHYLRNNKFAEAETVLLQLYQIDPKNPDGLINLGALYHLSENPKHDKQKALHFYKKAIEVKPNEAMVWMNLGLLYLGENLLQQAEVAFKNSLQIQPKSWVCYYGLARVYKRMGQRLLHEENLLKAKELKP